MNPRRWRALGVALIAGAAAGLGIVAVLASLRLAGIVLALAVGLLALLLYRELERAAELRLRTNEAEQQLATTTSHLEQIETIDPITKLASRFRFFERLQQEFRRSQRYHRPMACVLLDLDRFSAINEQYGEHFGDTVLAEFGAVVARDLRASDLAARYEGEAFALLLPETPAEVAEGYAERIRSALKQHVFSNGSVACSLSASFGIAGMPDARVSRTDDLVRLAAQALAEAKRRGRDRIVTDLPAPAPAAIVDLMPLVASSAPELPTQGQGPGQPSAESI
jgi:diguanylate cyclase (GGDEF)-like protein